MELEDEWRKAEVIKSGGPSAGVTPGVMFLPQGGRSKTLMEMRRDHQTVWPWNYLRINNVVWSWRPEAIRNKIGGGQIVGLYKK